jgi:hypothetical protein
MPKFEEEFKFPDEIEAEKKASVVEEDDIEVEIIDDTPEEDRVNSTPMPKDIVDELEQDELEEYSEKAKMRLKQLKKVWNDERRAKESAAADQAEAIRVANLLIEENKRLKGRLSDGEKTLVSNHKEKLERELADAKKEFKEAYDSGDSDRLTDAQERLTDVKFKSSQAENYKPEFEKTLQEEEIDVQSQQQPQRLDPKTQAWLDKNSWYGVDEDMSYLAMGVHRRLVKEGVPPGSENYFATIDAEMRRRFPEKLGDDSESKSSENSVSKTTAKVSKPSTVVAPATRSTSPKKITLTQRQLNLAKKFKLTPEQYARELTKLESQNG